VTALRKAEPRLVERLPRVRGRYRAAAPLARFTRFRVGGPAEVLFEPADEGDLARFLAGKPAEVPVTVIGLGSNLLVRDGGVPGVVVRLGAAFQEVRVRGAMVETGAAAVGLHVAQAARGAGVAGLEFLGGIPGTIGGAVRMNGGAYGVEMQDVTERVRAVDAAGAIHDLGPAALGFGYRASAPPADWIFVAARLRGRPGDPADIARRIADIQRARETSQPIRAATGGSTFKNPPGMKAWQLIERAGCRGLRRGGAVVSEKHCNFLVNEGAATAGDLEGLGEEVRRRVFEATGVTLEWEIHRVGVRRPGAPEASPP
jgi:UDP-N-acetylmuramate dehydrogenase